MGFSQGRWGESLEADMVTADPQEHAHSSLGLLPSCVHAQLSFAQGLLQDASRDVCTAHRCAPQISFWVQQLPGREMGAMCKSP